MVHSVSRWMWAVEVKLWDPLRMRDIPEHFRGVFTTSATQIHIYLYLYLSLYITDGFLFYTADILLCTCETLDMSLKYLFLYHLIYSFCSSSVAKQIVLHRCVHYQTIPVINTTSICSVHCLLWSEHTHTPQQYHRHHATYLLWTCAQLMHINVIWIMIIITIIRDLFRELGGVDAIFKHHSICLWFNFTGLTETT